MFRWVSNAAGLSFSIPVGVLSSPSGGEGGGVAVDLSTSTKPMNEQSPRSTPASLPTCDVQDCKALRKYRLVSDWEKGACGMGHLKILQGMIRS
jgi:Ino eighty subunit 2